MMKTLCVRFDKREQVEEIFETAESHGFTWASGDGLIDNVNFAFGIRDEGYLCFHYKIQENIIKKYVTIDVAADDVYDPKPSVFRNWITEIIAEELHDTQMTFTHIIIRR